MAGWLLRGYVTDDTYIHLRYAANLLELGEFSFNPGEQAYGATSPLWIFGLALFLKLGLPPLTAVWVLGALSGLAVILILDLILTRMTFSERWKFVVLIVAASDVWFLRWTYSGMETPLAALLMLVMLWPLFSGRERGWGITREDLWVRYLGWGAAAGLAGLTRPELLVIAPLALPWLLWFEYFRAVDGLGDRWRSRPHKPLLAAASGWAAVVVPWLVYAGFTFGRITPGTASAKSSAIAFVPLQWIESFMRSVSQLAAVQGPLWLGLVCLILMVLYRNRGRDERPRTRPLKVGVPLLDVEEEPDTRQAHGSTPLSVWSPVALMGIALTWTIATLAGYAIKQVWIISRYVSPLSPVLLLGMAVFAEWLLNGRRMGLRGRMFGRVVVGTAVVLALVLNWGIMGTQVVPHAREFPRGLRECYVGMGEWLEGNTPPDAVVAALDIGALGYHSDRQVLDLMGLVSPEILELGRDTGFEEMVMSGAWLQVADVDGRLPEYFVDRAEEPGRWSGRTVHGVRFELMDTCELAGVGLREPQTWTVALYRLVSVDKRSNPGDGG